MNCRMRLPASIRPRLYVIQPSLARWTSRITEGDERAPKADLNYLPE